MIVCQCTGVTDTTLATLIRSGVATLGEVIRCTGAGRCCAPCREEIAAIIESCAAAPRTS